MVIIIHHNDIPRFRGPAKFFSGHAQARMVFVSYLEKLSWLFFLFSTLKDARNFIITYGALSQDFSTYLPTIQKMIDSFAFIPTTAPAASNATTPAVN
jgi:hypothetical protein